MGVHGIHESRRYIHLIHRCPAGTLAATGEKRHAMTKTSRRAFIGPGEIGTPFTRHALRAAVATSSRAMIVGITYCSDIERFDIVRTEPLPSYA
jgi:hypothetical protein